MESIALLHRMYTGVAEDLEFDLGLIAAILSIMLQWGTAGAAVVVVWFTPTTGKPLRRVCA